jgi:hypothetical protein
MKRRAVVFTVLAMVVFASLAACEGGSFTDPGHVAYSGGESSGGGGGGGGSKPARIADSYNLSYDEAMDKADEIMEYCEKYSGPVNNLIKEEVYLWSAGIYSNSWNSSMRATAIFTLNEFIDELD